MPDLVLTPLLSVFLTLPNQLIHASTQNMDPQHFNQHHAYVLHATDWRAHLT